MEIVQKVVFDILFLFCFFVQYNIIHMIFFKKNCFNVYEHFACVYAHALLVCQKASGHRELKLQMAVELNPRPLQE